MKSIQLKSRAKINLSIDVLGKREDGYHLVEMIMQTIDLYDVITIEEIKENKIVVTSDSSNIPLDKNNIVYKAAKLVKGKFGIQKGINIFIQKNIPIAAGMAGGSSNAAAVLIGLNEMWNLGLDIKQLREIGLDIGADVPFCLLGGACLASGIGEELTDIAGLPSEIDILICKPELFISTQDVYRGLEINNIENRPNNEKLLEMLKNKDIVSVGKNMVNVLESVTSKKHSEIKHIEKIMIDNNALGSMMSGSGPTVFGLFENQEDAQRGKIELLKNYKQVYIVKASKRGVEVDAKFN